MSIDDGIPGAVWKLDGRRRAILEAIVARLIPSDGLGAGANEARATTYIERALASDLESLRDDYLHGLAAVDRHAVDSYGQQFTALSDVDRDALLSEFEHGNVHAPVEVSAGFFELVLQHTFEGTFGDPSWGGNVGRVGWSLIGYPGPRHVWTEQDQRLDVGGEDSRPMDP